MNKFLVIALCLAVIVNTASCAGSVTIAGLTITPTISGSNLSLAIAGNTPGYIGLGT